MAAGAVTLGELQVGATARWLGWAPGLRGRGGREVATTIKLCPRDCSFLP